MNTSTSLRLVQATIILALLSAATSRAAFVDKTADWCGGGDTKGSGTAVFCDYNEDGFLDLATEGGGWTGVDGTKFKPGGPQGCIAWADINNDGHLDYALVHGPGDHYLGDGNGGFTVGTRPPGPFGGECLAVAFGDINNDGLVDMFYGAGQTNKDSLWRQDPEHEQKWVLVGGSAGAYCRGVLSCDFDQDNDADFYVSNYWLCPNYLWLSDGKGGSAMSGKAAAGSGHSIGAACGDVDNDGYFDIFAGNFAHPGQSQSRFLRNTGPDGNYGFEDKGTCGVAFQESYASPTLGDYDNDGDLDLFFTTVYGHNAPRLYRNNGNWSFSDVTGAEGIPRLGATYQAAWGDVNNDGFLDLATAGRLFINKGNDNHWLKIKLKGDGTKVNSAAIGSQVRIKLGDQTLSRRVGDTVGQGSQNELTLHFGLGTHAGPIAYEVTWSNGQKQTGETEVDKMILVAQSVDGE